MYFTQSGVDTCFTRRACLIVLCYARGGQESDRPCDSDMVDVAAYLGCIPPYMCEDNGGI